MFWCARNISIWLMLATPLAHSAIARDRALQNQLSIVAASEDKQQQRMEDNESSEQQLIIYILETSDTQEVSQYTLLLARVQLKKCNHK